jgi:glyoxylase-like metal-dependent hydrolase (beta-lactamase superfamily II)
VEVADRVWVARSPAGDSTTTVVEGASGVVLVDPAGADGALHELLTAVRRLGHRQLLGVVLTHGHAAHSGGLAGLPDGQDVPVVVHEAAAARVEAAAGPLPGLRTVSSVTALDLGDRVVEVVHPGRGHTDGDVVVRVPDVDVAVVGDLVGGDGSPSYGPECWPLEWPGSLDLVLQLISGGGPPGAGPDGALVVPGHGPLLDPAGVEQQRDGIATVAEALRELAGRGVPEDRALDQGAAEGSWPWPVEQLTEAVRRGYAQLPRTPRQLPLA